MKATRSEALDIFKKWHAERTPLRCQILLRQIAASFDCLVYSVANNSLLLTSDDLHNEVKVPLPSDVTFGYGEDEEGGGIVIFLEPVPDEGESDMIIIADFKNPS